AEAPLGSKWGTPAGLRREPVFNDRFGWNQNFASLLDVPALIIRADLDNQTLEVDNRHLYEDLANRNKVYVHVACAGHHLLCETQHTALFNALAQWLTDATFYGFECGSFAIDSGGTVTQEDSCQTLRR